MSSSEESIERVVDHNQRSALCKRLIHTKKRKYIQVKLLFASVKRLQHNPCSTLTKKKRSKMSDGLDNNQFLNSPLNMGAQGDRADNKFDKDALLSDVEENGENSNGENDNNGKDGNASDFSTSE